MTHAYKAVYAPSLQKPKRKPKPEPRKIPPVKVFPDGREVCAHGFDEAGIAGRAEYKSRVRAMWERQDHVCCLYGFISECPGRLMLKEASFEHEDGRGGVKGRDDRIELPDGSWVNGAAHVLCNGLKGSRRIPYNRARNAIYAKST